jgi:hypothetical protein
MHYIDFRPPVFGIGGDFNTLRLGLFYQKRLFVNDTVLLVDSKEKLVIGTAMVTAVHNGRLSAMIREHATLNHTQINNLSGQSPQDALEEVIRKFYGPHIAVPNKATTVIYLRRIA